MRPFRRHHSTLRNGLRGFYFGFSRQGFSTIKVRSSWAKRGHRPHVVRYGHTTASTSPMWGETVSQQRPVIIQTALKSVTCCSGCYRPAGDGKKGRFQEKDTAAPIISNSTFGIRAACPESVHLARKPSESRRLSRDVRPLRNESQTLS